eukprot:scaffold16451_cov59-Phaeocystis_antarctica.AAC.1
MGGSLGGSGEVRGRRRCAAQLKLIELELEVRARLEEVLLRCGPLLLRGEGGTAVLIRLRQPERGAQRVREPLASLADEVRGAAQGIVDIAATAAASSLSCDDVASAAPASPHPTPPHPIRRRPAGPAAGLNPWAGAHDHLELVERDLAVGVGVGKLDHVLHDGLVHRPVTAPAVCE